jgi:hypothetical protein
MIKDHGIWQDISKWIIWIYKVIESRRHEFVNKKVYSTGSESNEYAKKTSGWIKGWIKGMAKMFIGKSNTEDVLSDDVTKNISLTLECHLIKLEYTLFYQSLTQLRGEEVIF